MKLQLLGSSVRDASRRQYVTSYLINGAVAIDAGCLGFHGSPQEQEKIRHVSPHFIPMPTTPPVCRFSSRTPGHPMENAPFPALLSRPAGSACRGWWSLDHSCPVNHVVPTFGYIVRDRYGAVTFSPVIRARPRDCGRSPTRLRICEQSSWRRRFPIL